MLLNRADELVNEEKVSDWLTNHIIEKRISDINKIEDGKQADVAKAFAKGFIAGYYNGQYSTDREFKPNNKITRKGVLNCIKMIKDKSLRYKMSPDGQVCRTTNLPKYAKHHPYILKSIPNSYYDWRFYFEGTEWYKNGEKWYLVNLLDYASPKNIWKLKGEDNLKNISNDSDVRNQYLELWQDRAEGFLNTIFNVDYRTIDEKEWINELSKYDFNYIDGGFFTEDQNKQQQAPMRRYIKMMKENKTIVESSKIVIDRSSLHYVDGKYRFRAYVKYRINSSKMTPKEANEYTFKYYPGIKTDQESNILYYSYGPVYIEGFELGKWKSCCFDVVLTRNSYNPDKWDLGIGKVVLTETMYKINRIK